MQREALIVLTVLLTLAVLGAGGGPEAASAATQAMPAHANDVANAADESDKATLHRVGPFEFQMVGTEDNAHATLTVKLDVSI